MKCRKSYKSNALLPKEINGNRFKGKDGGIKDEWEYDRV